MCTGDKTQPDLQKEVHWFDGEYNSVTDTWTWTFIFSGEATNYLKATGIVILNNIIYWAADAPGGGDTQYGIWYSDVDLFSNPVNHIRLAPSIYSDMTGLVYDEFTKTFISVYLSDGSNVITFTSLTGNHENHIIANIAQKVYALIGGKNKDGYYRINTNYVNTPQTDTLFIKVGFDAFTYSFNDGKI